MIKKIIVDPNTTSSNIITDLEHLKKQGEKYSKYDDMAPKFKSDKIIEPFFAFKNIMFDKILIILIVGLLAIFIMKAMEFM